MEHLFDTYKPRFKVWLTLCDIDICPNQYATFYGFAFYTSNLLRLPYITQHSVDSTIS